PPTPDAIASGGFSLSVQEMRQQAYTSAGPNGEQRLAVLVGGGDRAGDAPPHIAPPGGAGEELQPTGPPTLLDSAHFAYHLSGQEAPARVVMIMLPRGSSRVTRNP